MADPSATQRDPAGVTGPTPDTAPPPRRPFWLVLLAVFAINFLLVNLIFPGPRRPVQVPYTTFREQVRAGNVEAIATRADMVQGTFAEPLEIELPNGTHVEVGAFSTTLPAFVDPGLEALLLDHGVVINAEPLETPRRDRKSVV